jgi:hypothetical protein
MPVGLTRHRHVPEASLVVGHPQEGVFSFSGLFADGGLELAINRTLEVADVGPETVGGQPVHELPVGVSTGALILSFMSFMTSRRHFV